MEFPGGANEQVRSIVKSCLTVNEHERFSAEQVLMHFFPFARETLLMSLHSLYTEPSQYKVAAFSPGLPNAYKTSY